MTQKIQTKQRNIILLIIPILIIWIGLFCIFELLSNPLTNENIFCKSMGYRGSIDYQDNTYCYSGNNLILIVPCTSNQYNWCIQTNTITCENEFIDGCGNFYPGNLNYSSDEYSTIIINQDKI